MSEEKQELTAVTNESKSKYYLPEIPKVERAKIAEYLMDKHIVKGGLTKDEVEHATELCLALNLNPIKKEIYFVAYGEGKYRQFSPIASYTTYIAKGQQTRLLDGFETSIEEKDGQVYSATCTIHRKDWDRPFTSTVYYSEMVKYKGKTKDVTEFWSKMPRKMLSKCAVVDAFRSCFAGVEELQGLPYIQEELAGDFIDVPSKPAPKAVEAPKLDVKALIAHAEKQGLKSSDVDKIAFDYCTENKIEPVNVSEFTATDQVRKFFAERIKELVALNEAV